jgi:hypothetical protein
MILPAWIVTAMSDEAILRICDLYFLTGRADLVHAHASLPTP